MDLNCFKNIQLFVTHISRLYGATAHEHPYGKNPGDTRYSFEISCFRTRSV